MVAEAHRAWVFQISLLEWKPSAFPSLSVYWWNRNLSVKSHAEWALPAPDTGLMADCLFPKVATPVYILPHFLFWNCDAGILLPSWDPSSFLWDLIASPDRMRWQWHCLTPEAWVLKDSQASTASACFFLMQDARWGCPELTHKKSSYTKAALLGRSYGETQRHHWGACVFVAPNTGAGTSHLICARHGFLTRRIHEHNNCLFYSTAFWGGCYPTTGTGTDANSESISMVKKESRNQKADGGCSYSYFATCWHSWMAESAKTKAS